MIQEIEKIGRPKYHYVVEQVFQNRYGLLLDYKVINYLLKSDSPSSDIYNCMKGLRYIDFGAGKDVVVKYKDKLNLKKLTLRKWMFIVFYYVASLSGFGMIMLIPFFKVIDPIYLILNLSILIWAYLCLDESYRPEAAIKFIEKHQSPLNNA